MEYVEGRERGGGKKRKWAKKKKKRFFCWKSRKARKLIFRALGRPAKPKWPTPWLTTRFFFPSDPLPDLPSPPHYYFRFVGRRLLPSAYFLNLWRRRVRLSRINKSLRCEIPGDGGRLWCSEVREGRPRRPRGEKRKWKNEEFPQKPGKREPNMARAVWSFPRTEARVRTYACIYQVYTHTFDYFYTEFVFQIIPLEAFKNSILNGNKITKPKYTNIHTRTY